jgi:hypothetical protein
MKGCGLNFIEGDRRLKPETDVKKALCVLLYSLGKASFSMLGKILGHSPSIIYRWVTEAMDATPEPNISWDIQEIEFDEMWHFLKKRVHRLWVHQTLGRPHNPRNLLTLSTSIPIYLQVKTLLFSCPK